MATHRAAVLLKPGEALVDQTVETTQDLEPWEVRVRNHAIAINPADWMQQQQGMLIPSYPHVLGIDSAGVIEAIGADVKGRKVGQRVACFTDNTRGFKWGGHQEKVIIWGTVATPIPDSMSFAEASSLPTCFATAAVCLGLYLNLPVFGYPSPVTSPSTTPVVVLGASSSVGQCALQLLRNHGFTHVVASASPSNFDLVKKLGASHAVDYKTADFAQQVEAAVGGKAPYVLMATGSQQQAADIVSEAGKVSITVHPDESIKWPCPPPVWASSFRFLDAPADAPGKGAHPDDFAFGQKANAYLTQALAEGTFRGNPVQTIDATPAKGKSLAAALTEGMQINRKGASGFKVVIEL